MSVVRLSRVGLVVVKHRQGDPQPIELKIDGPFSAALTMAEAVALRDTLTTALDREEAHSEH